MVGVDYCVGSDVGWIGDVVYVVVFCFVGFVLVFFVFVWIGGVEYVVVGGWCGWCGFVYGYLFGDFVCW